MYIECLYRHVLGCMPDKIINFMSTIVALCLQPQNETAEGAFNYYIAEVQQGNVYQKKMYTEENPVHPAILHVLHPQDY
jgi:hypothetical protein